MKRSDNFFGKDFYPTSSETANMMDIDCSGKVVCEPQAGKGDLVMWLKENGAKEVIVCEKHPELAKIAKTKGKFLKHDFFEVTAEEISHVQMIVMNPPFSSAVKHILHAWAVAPAGCEIISLINQNNLTNDYSKERGQLKTLINNNGLNTVIGSVFTDAERETDCEIGLIKLYKPNVAGNEFDGFFMDEDPAEEQGNGIMPHNKVREVVQRYIASVKLFEEHEALASKMSNLTSPFKVGAFSFEMGYKNQVFTKADFKKELQKKAWGYLFDTMNLRKYVTSGVMKDINKFVEEREKYPFTMKNIYKMFEIIVGTRENTFNKAIEEAIDNFTRYTDENRFGVEGWKTNSGHMLNKKFIVNNMVTNSTGTHFSTSHGGNHENIVDMVKVLCSLTATDYDDLISLSNTVRYHYRLFAGKKYVYCYDDKEWEVKQMKATQKEYYEQGIATSVDVGRPEYGKWFDWGFFECRAYKKGTMHFKFKDDKLWELLNRKYAAIKGQVLPEKFKQKSTKKDGSTGSPTKANESHLQLAS